MDQSLVEASTVLFGSQARVAGQAFLGRLEAGEVKRAFRRLALRTHPDLAGGGGSGRADPRRFIEVLQAYERLAAFVDERTSRPASRAAPRPQRPAPPSPPPSPPPGGHPGRGPTGGAAQGARGAAAGKPGAQKPGTQKPEGSKPGAQKPGTQKPEARPAAGLFYRGPLPQRPLRLAEYLYYKGLISWQSLIEAIVWQRKGRPKFGELAQESRTISRDELLHVLRSRQHAEQMGDAAVRLRLLTTEEVAAILRRQRARQKRIGGFFVESERMSREDLSRNVLQLLRHNARYRQRD